MKTLGSGSVAGNEVFICKCPQYFRIDNRSKISDGEGVNVSKLYILIKQEMMVILQFIKS